MSAERKRPRWRGTSRLDRLSLGLKYLNLFSALFIVGYSLYGLTGSIEYSGYSTIVVIALLAFSLLCFYTAMAIDQKLRKREEPTTP